MVRRYVSAGLAALSLGFLAIGGGCAGSGTLIFPSVAIFTVNGNNQIAPLTSDVVAGGTVEIDNTNTTQAVTVSFSSLFTTPWTIPPNGRTDVPLPTVANNTALTITVTAPAGGNAAVLNIHI